MSCLVVYPGETHTVKNSFGTDFFAGVSAELPQKFGKSFGDTLAFLASPNSHGNGCNEGLSAFRKRVA